MINIDLAAIVAQLQWWHLLWVIAASLVWSAANIIAEEVVARLSGRSRRDLIIRRFAQRHPPIQL